MHRKIFMENQRGATSVEFAIVCLLLITFVFGVIEFGLLLYNKQIITNASREGARYGIVAREVRRKNTQIEAEVKKYSEQHLVTFGPSGTPVVTILDEFYGDADDFDPTANRCMHFEIEKEDENKVKTKIRCELKVEVEYLYTYLFLSTLGLGPINIKSAATMRME